MIYWLAYAICYLLTWRSVVWFFVTDMPSSRHRRPTTEEILMGIVMGSMINVASPVILVGHVSHRFCTRHKGLTLSLLMPRSARKEERVKEQERLAKEQAWKIKTQAERIRALEQEVLD